MNYAVTSLWLFLAYAGWAIALGGLSALQHYVNDSGSNGGWAIPANYPLLRAGTSKPFYLQVASWVCLRLFATVYCGGADGRAG